MCDLLANLNIKDKTGDIETALESLKLQVSPTEAPASLLSKQTLVSLLVSDIC